MKPPFIADNSLYTSSTTESEDLNAVEKRALYLFRYFVANPLAFLLRSFMKLWYAFTAFILLIPGAFGFAFAVMHFPLSDKTP
jgi:hypothetical protein